MSAALLRRGLVFLTVFGAGIGVVAATSGGLFLPEDPASSAASSARVPDPPGGLVPVAPGTALGPGRDGRIVRNAVAVVGGKPVAYRELTAEWETSTAAPSRDPEMQILEFGGARLVFHPRPTEEVPSPPATETAPGVTILSGRQATVRRKGEGPAAAHLEGDCVGRHLLDGAESLVLRSPALDFRREESGGAGTPMHVVSTESPVEMEGGGAEVKGTGMVAELEETDRGTRGRRQQDRVRILRDVDALFRDDPDRTIRVLCDGPGEIVTLDAPSSDGRQPWRASFRDRVRVAGFGFVRTRDGAGGSSEPSTLTADQVTVEFVRTGAADRKAGAPSTEVRSVTAIGHVVVDGGEEGARYHLECGRLRRFAEDALTDVTVAEGSPVLRFIGRSQGAAPTDAGVDALSVYEIRCAGPVTVRERRAAAAGRRPERATFVAEDDVVATERQAGADALRSEVRAPRVTIEAERDATGRLDPRVIRGEQGARARWNDFAAEAQTISAISVPAQGGPAVRRLALVGRPVLSFRLAEGSSPLGGKEPPGLLVLTSDSRIDAEIAADPPKGSKPTGTRAWMRTADHFVARKTVGSTDEWTWRLEADRGDAKVDWNGMLEEMHALGTARLDGRAAGQDGERTGVLTGEDITLQRPAASRAASKSDALRRLDATVDGSASRPARAEIADAGDESRRHVVTGRRLVQTEDGAVLVATGDAVAEMHRDVRRSAAGPVRLAADRIRVDLERPDGEPSRARLVTADGSVRLDEAVHRLRGDHATYAPLSGEAEVTAEKAAVLVRSDDPQFPSYVRGRVIRAWFDPTKSGDETFVRGHLPEGGEVVGYFAEPSHRRVTTTSKGPIDVTRTAATSVDQVVSVSETRPTPGSGWIVESRIDCTRLETEFDPTVTRGNASERIRSLVATGTPALPARVGTRSPAGDREAYSEAERIEWVPSENGLSLSCPSERSRVLYRDVSGGRAWRCDSVRFNYRTHEWTHLERASSED